MTIRDYLCREAARITDGALAGITDAAAWCHAEPERRRQYREMMGLTELPPAGERPPVPVTVTGVVERPAYRIEKLYYESMPGLFVTANLYVPRDLSSPAPGVLYVCGHGDNQKVWYQAHARRFAELGFVCLIAETVQLGEVHGHHHGCYREGWFHWYSRGYSPAQIEALNGIRALDLLAQRPEVDASRLGVTGTSGGGATSWWVAAADERVTVAAPSCGTATLRAHVGDRLLDDHCDCMWWINTYRWDLADVGALIAPRPLMIASADRDSLNTIAAIREVHRQLVPLYEMLGAPENLKLVTAPGPHAYHAITRTAIFSWFVRHLLGREVPPAEVGDIDDAHGKQESFETLRVYTNGSPPGNRTTTIQNDLFTPPAPPEITDQASLDRARQNVGRALRERTFHAFPADPPPLDTQVEYEFQYRGGRRGNRFAFTSEEGWRLHGRLLGPTGAAVGGPAPVIVVALRSPGETLWAAEAFAGKIAGPWAIAAVEPRGTGDTAWGPELQWHVRRAAAWAGRTIASMQVWDTLRALEAVRSLPGAEGAHIALAAQGEMAPVALYAALLDGGVTALFLESPPATQDAPSAPDGRGPAIEMLNCLRITDLPQVAGLLFPASVVIAGECPASYAWAEDVYRTLGRPETFQRVGDLAEWRPA
jgi:dienelactone hydrolase